MPTTVKSSKKISLNIYLLKENVAATPSVAWSKDDYLNKPLDARGVPRKVSVDTYLLGSAGEYGVMYIRRPQSQSAPEWIEFVAGGMEDATKLDKLKNKSVSALLVTNAKNRQFALAFGHGRHLLDQACVEQRFGIRVALNSISPEKIASLDKQTFEAMPRISRTQAIRTTSVSDYGINAEQDLLKALVGQTKKEYSDKLGDVIAGMDSLKTTVGIEICELQALLEMALERAASDDYLKKGKDGTASAFAWVDNLQAVSDKSLLNQLDNELWTLFVKDDFSSMWLAIPEILDWADITGFAYSRKQLAEADTLFTKLDIQDLKSSLRAGAVVGTLKHTPIFMVTASGAPPQSFASYKCLYAEVTYSKVMYVLNAGSWYRVEENFQKSVQDFFANLPRIVMAHPFMEYDHKGEGPYNEAVAAVAPNDVAMLDRDLIAFGGKHSKIETCDLFIPSTATDPKSKFFHVKRGRSSANLSHLFAQGLVSSSLLVREPVFVGKVNKQLTGKGFDPLPVKVDGKDHEVVFAIIDGPHTKPIDIPFFSKVNLQQCCGNIRAYGFDVKLLHIPESAAYLAAERVKATAKAKAKATTKAKSKKKTGVKTPSKKPTGKKSVGP